MQPGSPSLGSRSLGIGITIAPALVVLLLLAPFVAADPVPGVTSSHTPFTDEAYSVANARSWALFGTFATDEWALYLLNLPFAVLNGLVFRVFGVGLVQARLTDVALVALTALVLAVGLRRLFGGPAAFVAASGYATSSLVLYYGRMAYIEPLAGLFLVSGVLTLAGIGGSRAGLLGLLGGTLLALAVGTKLIVAPGVVMVLGVATVAAIRMPAARRWTAGAALALALAATWYLLVVWLPNLDRIADVRERIYPQVSPLTIRTGIRRLTRFLPTTNDGLLVLAAPLLVAAFAGLAVAVRRKMALDAPAVTLLAAAAAAVSVNTVVLALSGYSPNRYFVPLLPLLAILAAPAAQAIVEVAASRAARPAPGRAGAARAAVALGLAIVLGLQGVVLHASWVRAGGHQLAEAQAKAAAVIPDGATIAGRYATLLGMRTSAYAVMPCCTAGGVNTGDLYAAGARWWADSVPPRWADLHPDAWATAEVIACLEGWDSKGRDVCLWRLP